MTKILAVTVVAVLFFSCSLSTSWASENQEAEAGLSGTPEEYNDLEKTLRQDRLTTIESRLSDLMQANKFMSERVKMLERSVNDLKDKVDRSFR